MSFDPFIDYIFSDSYVTTFGGRFQNKNINIIIDFKKLKTSLWDPVGQERFRNIISYYYRGAQGIILVYDITDLKFFQNLYSWLLKK